MELESKLAAAEADCARALEAEKAKDGGPGWTWKLIAGAVGAAAGLALSAL